MSHPYKTRSGGATVTIFVPYDCRNHCPFCINKKEYADCTGFKCFGQICLCVICFSGCKGTFIETFDRHPNRSVANHGTDIAGKRRISQHSQILFEGMPGGYTLPYTDGRFRIGTKQ